MPGRETTGSNEFKQLSRRYNDKRNLNELRLLFRYQAEFAVVIQDATEGDTSAVLTCRQGRGLSLSPPHHDPAAQAQLTRTLPLRFLNNAGLSGRFSS